MQDSSKSYLGGLLVHLSGRTGQKEGVRYLWQYLGASWEPGILARAYRWAWREKCTAFINSLKFIAELRDFCDEVFSSRNSLTVHKIGCHINWYCMLDKTHFAAALLSVGFVVFSSSCATVILSLNLQGWEWDYKEMQGHFRKIQRRVDILFKYGL